MRMTLHNAYDDQNIFAKILRGEMPCAKVFEDGGTLVIMDAFPQSKGHCLVIPRGPSVNLLHVKPKDIGRLFGTCLLYTSPSPRDGLLSRMPSSA